MIYEYRCVQCGLLSETPFFAPIGQTIDLPCGECGGRRRRIVSNIAIHRTDYETHFNHTIGSVVHNKREFNDQLKYKNDEMSERTGFESDYQPIDMRDKEACKVTEEGLDDTYRAQFRAR